MTTHGPWTVLAGVPYDRFVPFSFVTRAYSTVRRQLSSNFYLLSWDAPTLLARSLSISMPAGRSEMHTEHDTNGTIFFALEHFFHQ